MNKTDDTLDGVPEKLPDDIVTARIKRASNPPLSGDENWEEDEVTNILPAMPALPSTDFRDDEVTVVPTGD